MTRQGSVAGEYSNWTHTELSHWTQTKHKLIFSGYLCSCGTFKVLGYLNGVLKIKTLNHTGTSMNMVQSVSMYVLTVTRPDVKIKLHSPALPTNTENTFDSFAVICFISLHTMDIMATVTISSYKIIL
jgi:hypothetical protein